MLIVRLTGGLGNQMFQYSLYKSLKNYGEYVVIDNYSFVKRHSHEIIKLQDVFPRVNFDLASNSDISKIGDLGNKCFDKIRRRLLGKYKSHIYEKEIRFHPTVFRLNKGSYYLDGYWQSERYFKNVEKDIRYEFVFEPIEDQINIEFAKQISAENSISIHVRKGNDFRSKSRFDTCGIGYYRRAIEEMRNKVRDPVFYVFSDNFEWCDANLSFIERRNIDWNEAFGSHSYIDMQLMTLCKHNIIANSTFSWWAGWLNSNIDKIVIAPDVWFNANTIKFDIGDIIPESWIISRCNL